MSSEDPHVEFGLLMAFDTSDPEFARGFELGRLWQLLEQIPDAEPLERELVHATSAEMILRLADATGRQATSVELDGHWLEVTFSAVDGVEISE